MNIHKVLTRKFKGRLFSCKGDHPNHEIEYYDELPPPTEQELLTAWEELLIEEPEA